MRPSRLTPLSTPSWIAVASLLLAFIVLPAGDFQPTSVEAAESTQLTATQD